MKVDGVVDRAFPTVTITGVEVAVTNPDAAAQAVIEVAERPASARPLYACATSVHGLIEASQDPDYKEILNSAWLVAPLHHR